MFSYYFFINVNQVVLIITNLKKQLKALIISTIPIFKEKQFFMNDEFSLVDCCIAPILWRLPQVEIDIPQNTKHNPLNEYMKIVFTRQ